MKVSISFHKIQVNLFQNKKELIFPYGDDWYRMDWENVPEQYKIMYVAWLKFQGIEVPEDCRAEVKELLEKILQIEKEVFCRHSEYKELKIAETSGTEIRAASAVNNPAYTEYSSAWANRLSLVYDYLKVAVE